MRTAILTKTKLKMYVGEESVIITQFSKTVTTKKDPTAVEPPLLLTTG